MQCVHEPSLSGGPGPQIIMGEDGDIPGRLVDWLIGYQTNNRGQPEHLLSSIYEVQLQGVEPDPAMSFHLHKADI